MSKRQADEQDVPDNADMTYDEEMGEFEGEDYESMAESEDEEVLMADDDGNDDQAQDFDRVKQSDAMSDQK